MLVQLLLCWLSSPPSGELCTSSWTVGNHRDGGSAVPVNLYHMHAWVTSGTVLEAPLHQGTWLCAPVGWCWSPTSKGTGGCQWAGAGISTN